MIPLSPKLRTSPPSDTAGAKPARIQASNWNRAARWIGASLTLKLVALVGIFVALPIVLYGRAFWSEVLNFDALIRWGTISPSDLSLFHVADTPDEAFSYLTRELGSLYGDREPEAPSV